MRKTHCACLLLGLLLGMPLGVGLVVLHMKYGQGPIVAVDCSPEAVRETVLVEPTPDGAPLGDDGWAAADPGQPAADGAGSPLGLVPIGPVEVTVVQRTNSRSSHGSHPTLLTQAEPEDEASRRESCERRMLQHLLRQAQASVEQNAVLAEPVEAPMPEADAQPAELAQPETLERLPMPTAEPAQETVVPDEPRFSSSRVYPAPVPAVIGIAPPAPRNSASMAEDFASVISWLKVPARVPYTGAYPCSFVDTGVLQLPAEVHEMLDSPRSRPRTLYLVPMQEQVRLYTAKGLKNLLQALQVSGIWGKENQREQAVWSSCIRRVQVAADGKLTIPAELAKFGGLQDKVVLVGVYDHIEIWDARAWREAVASVPAVSERSAVPPDEDGETVREVPHD